MNAAQLDMAVRVQAALTEALADAEATGTGYVRIRRVLGTSENLPVIRTEFERIDPETVMIEVEFEPGDRASEPENFE